MPLNKETKPIYHILLFWARVDLGVMAKTVPSQPIQFNNSTQFSSIWPIDRTLSGATTPSQSGPWSDGSEEVLCIPQSSIITET